MWQNFVQLFHLKFQFTIFSHPGIVIFYREEEITWFMEVMCYGLSLPLSEHDTVKDCVNVYCEWISALLPGEPKTW